MFSLPEKYLRNVIEEKNIFKGRTVTFDWLYYRRIHFKLVR